MWLDILILILATAILYHFKIKRGIVTDILEFVGGFCIISLMFGFSNYQYLLIIIIVIIIERLL